MRRSWISASAHDAGRLDEALDSGADALVVDLSQGEPRNAAEGRKDAIRWLKRCRARERPLPGLYVMVRACDTARLQDDVAALTPLQPDGFLLSGARHGADIQKLDVMIAAQEAIAGLAPGCIDIIALPVDTAAGAFGAGTYAGKSARLKALAWSADRLAASLGIANWQGRDGATPALDTACGLCLLGAAAGALDAIDLTSPVGDMVDFTAQCRQARAKGFSGKLVMHARQAEIANVIFSM